MTQEPSIVIVGSGFSGLGMAIRLKQHGQHDFVILEKKNDLGGVWRDNHYPGAACDVPSLMYSFSFEQNPNWSRLFAPRAEVQEYIRRCADKYGVTDHIRYGCQVEALEWREEERVWHVRLRDGREFTPQVVISAIGVLHVPAYPEIPGADRFGGRTFHSAVWDHSYDLTGKRVAVIGTGASAVQFVPKIAPQVESLRVFQRSAPWIHASSDVVIPEKLRQLFARVPGAQRFFRNAIFWLMEARTMGFAINPKMMRPLERVARNHLHRAIPDPELRAKATPDYTIGCKRILVSSEYYPALCRPHVDLVTDAIAEITETGIVTKDGTEHEVDAIIYGTGFRVMEAVAEQTVIGRDGLKLQDAWADGMEAHYGTTIAGFPNFFMLEGPNTGAAYNSAIFVIETQAKHVARCLRMRESGGDAVEVRPEAQRRSNERLRRRLAKSVWSVGGCNSWILDKNGRNVTMWPGFATGYWLRARIARRRDYEVRTQPRADAQDA
jgi:cation diffusion facilitator CzcD-associated flavoprotein CzcO